MKLSPLTLVMFFLAAAALAPAQTIVRRQSSNVDVNNNEGAMALRAIMSLKRLEAETIVYRSLGEFEENGKLARVSLDNFKAELDKVIAEVNSTLPSLPETSLKNGIRNALASYRDGVFWWQQVYQPRVINVSSLTPDRISTSTDTFLMANIPYTVAIHWRQASKYLQRAEREAAGNRR